MERDNRIVAQVGVGPNRRGVAVLTTVRRRSEVRTYRTALMRRMICEAIIVIFSKRRRILLAQPGILRIALTKLFQPRQP